MDKPPLSAVLTQFPPLPLALIATLFTRLVTAAGGALVSRTRRGEPKVLDAMLDFAAGAMIFVVEELIPESRKNPGPVDLVTLATLTGFAVMMVIDVALG